MDINKIKEIIFKRDFYKRFAVVLFGVFLLAIDYNLFLLPNHFVIGGTTGLSIVVEDLFGWNPQVFLYITTALLILVSFLFLGVKKTSISIVGSIMYPFFITLTQPLSEMLKPYVAFDNVVLLIIVAGSLYGFAYGIIYRMGFDTGGSDIMIRIVNKYFHMSEGKCSMYVQGTIILIGGLVFGINQMIYAILILVIYTSLMDKIIIGISDSKLFFVHTKHRGEVQHFILEDLHAGVTILETQGGYTKEKTSILMCVVPNKDYYLFKEMILQIDPDAFFIINDCYEVQGGVKRRNLPFI